MKPLSERDENIHQQQKSYKKLFICRNEATLWKRWEPNANLYTFPFRNNL